MKHKSSILLSLLALISTAVVANEKLTTFDMIKSSLLNGSNVKMVVDLKTCTMIDEENNGGPGTAPNTFGIMLTSYAINYKTGNVESGDSYYSGPDKKYPANYQTQEVSISSDNKVDLELKIVSVPSHKLIKTSRYLCTVDNANNKGIKFFTV